MAQKQDAQQNYVGIWPVILTPFDEKREIDYDSLARLIEWYLAAGVHGLFAACQSSEMFFLSDRETQQLVRFIVQQVDGRVPVVASGHTANSVAQQVDQLNGVAQGGVDGLILISNRLALAEGSRLHLANANGQTLLASFQAGCQAYSGVMANFHPQLYVWLYENWRTHPEQAQALAEHLDYPACAKYFQQQVGNFATHSCRVRNSAGHASTFFPAAIDSMMRLGESLVQRVTKP
ncbi:MULTISPECIES: dihydrodipicolinate synthase family protein [Symbiopectobacterium]|uniref:dihydrodipicolinate synthase family protein n=1 Tax=Symbiopectobacterium TaxID=801 RepID=UPI001A2D2938|nr:MULTISPECIES: dihydrodipicolinate synthase family protein [Symbiopectobacterium]MBG6246804.1 dihydrodipicolinate synthase family protein [Candidatus Symbiopectobacterium sp. PLON1]MBT9430137.1 dihydrodipicolinate synthase family protein [Candidatus Symbiopectobacterium endolongispinus]